MSLRVVCPNGHVLNVKESLAGKTGLCPKCKSHVQVPALAADDGLSEDLIMGILGSKTVQPAAPVAAQREAKKRPDPASGDKDREKTGPPKKSCHRCNREISAVLHICPHCHTYIAKLGDF